MASLYFTEQYELQENVILMANVQFAYNEYQIRNEKFLNNSFSVPYYFVNPRLGLNYNVTETWNTYVSFGYTSREPRLRNLYSAEDSYLGALPAFHADTAGGITRYDFNRPIAKPEQLMNLELGVGYKTNTIQLNGNVYWMEFTDELIKSGQVDIFGNPVYGNAPRTRHIGFEIDGAVTLLEQIVISGNASLSTNYIVTFSSIDSDSNKVLYATSLKNNPIAGFPDVTANLRLTYQRERFSTSFVAKYVGSFYTDNFKNAANKNDGYAVMNVESLYSLPKIGDTQVSLRGEIRNVLNALYMQNGEGEAYFPAAERNYLVGISVQI